MVAGQLLSSEDGKRKTLSLTTKTTDGTVEGAERIALQRDLPRPATGDQAEQFTKAKRTPFAEIAGHTMGALGAAVAPMILGVANLGKTL